MRRALALSGGGSRAIVFHLGFLRRLAELGLLEQVTKLSTVSGGSIVVGMIYSHNDGRWPTSKEFLETVFPRLATIMTTTPLFSWWTVLTSPLHWLLFPFHRAYIVIWNLQQRWGIRGKIADLPELPEWTVNTTCYETGANWRFSQRRMGDWKFGRREGVPYSIDEIIAASAAVPYGLGTVDFKLPTGGWKFRDFRRGTTLTSDIPPLAYISLWDGGAYENLGLEPVFKPDQGLIGCDDLLVSDASAYVSTARKDGLPPFFKLVPRLFDIASDQIRALRSRMLVQALSCDCDCGDLASPTKRPRIQGALIKIGNHVSHIEKEAGQLRPDEVYASYHSQDDVERCHKFGTHLRAFSRADFEALARHGYECTEATLATRRPDISPGRGSWHPLTYAERPWWKRLLIRLYLADAAVWP